MVIDSIDDLFKKNCNNYDEVRGHFLASSMYHPKALFLFSSNCGEDYATRVQKESDRMVEDDSVVLTDSPQLEYTTPKNKGNQVSKTADPSINSR